MARDAPSYAEVVKRGKDASELPSGYEQDITGTSTQVDVRSTDAGIPGKDRRKSEQQTVKGTSESLASGTMPLILIWSFILTLIFGGCCSNVYALEAIIKDESDSGLLITYVQFILVSLFAFPSNASISNPPTFLKQRAVPLRRWIPNVLMFFTVNMMNNYAFGFKISVPVHIILRSGGSVTTLVVGWVWGKRYTRGQIFGVIMLTIGVVIAAMADAQAKGKMGGSAAADIKDFNAGLIILFVAQLLSAIMGVYVQDTYALYGSHWRENLFYSHFLSLPLFSPILPSLYRQYQRLVDSPPVTLTLPKLDLQRGVLPQLRSLWRKNFILAASSKAHQQALITLPKHVYTLFLNALTQYACIRGVNLLGARTTALGVTIVLNLRKLVSLFASIWLFGNELPVGVMIGAAIVFSGAGVYAWGGSGKSKQRATSKQSKPKAA